MMNFCTLYDSNYISKGLALYLSIAKYTDDFTMYVMAMDRKCQEMLKTLAFKHVIVDCIKDIDDPKLQEAKGNRSRAEFCWTCGSYTTDYFLHKYNLLDITYLDSDLMFFCSPQVVSDELEKKNASIGLAPHFTKNPLFGRYCVQYVYFKNDENGSECLRWWKDECLKWCYSKLENGKYGDQKYLDYFADRFDSVYAIENRGVGIAAWNMDSYKYLNGRVIYKKKEWPFVFFHYSNFKVSVEQNVLYIRHTVFVNNCILETFVKPYSLLLMRIYREYLGQIIDSIIIEPVEQNGYFRMKIGYYLKRILPIDSIIMIGLKVKYRERKSPYSEK